MILYIVPTTLTLCDLYSALHTLITQSESYYEISQLNLLSQLYSILKPIKTHITNYMV